MRFESPERLAQPDVRPLGWLALGFALLSVLLAVTYFWLAYLAAVPALTLGVIARKDESTHYLGIAAVVIATVAILGTTVLLVVAF